MKKGEVFGFIGTNGSGKTTTIREMMGFIKPDQGNVTIAGLDPWKDGLKLRELVSYVPGEISFPRLKSGTEFLKLQAEYLDLKDTKVMTDLLERFHLDASANLSRMSKGMKQKTAIVAALMGDRDILILDEPTTGLDPLMREVFLDLIRQEKEKGKTIFMSTHIFEEVEEVCDRAALISDGHFLGIADIYSMRHEPHKTFIAEFESEAGAKEFADKFTSGKCERKNSVCTIQIEKNNEQEMIRELAPFDLAGLSEKRISVHDRLKDMIMKGAGQDERA